MVDRSELPPPLPSSPPPQSLPQGVKRYHRAPWAPAFMAAACLPRRRGAGWPAAHWHAVQVPPAARARFARLTASPVDDDALPLMLLHTWSLRLQMAVLTHPAFPLPIWHGLQLRNRLWLRRAVPAGARLDLDVRVVAERRLARGCEFDLRVTLADADGPAFEGLSTFYHRGRRCGDAAPAAQATPPGVDAPPQWRWTTPAGGGWAFGTLCGDYNPLHWSDAWARRLGFPGAFLHPSRAVAAALARLPGPPPDAPQRLDVWIRGPLRYARPVTLAVEPAPAPDTAPGVSAPAPAGPRHLQPLAPPVDLRFALHGSDDARAAIVGRWIAGGPAATAADPFAASCADAAVSVDPSAAARCTSAPGPAGPAQPR